MIQIMNNEQLYQTVDGLKESGSIIFEQISGSKSYGTDTPESDTDIRGLFILPRDWHLSIFNPPAEITIDKQDIKYYELKKFITLASEVNPNIVEMLFPPDECIRVMTPVMKKLLDHRSLFISKKAFHTFLGYSFSQISKAKSANKMVNDEGNYEPGIARLQHWLNTRRINQKWLVENFSTYVSQAVCKGAKLGIEIDNGMPLDKANENLLTDPDVLRLMRPHRNQFCWFIPTNRSELIYNFKTKFLPYLGENKWPVRPEPLDKAKIDLSKYHAAALEHVDGLYRLYYYGDEARGVFRDAGMPVLESIPKEDEWSKFRGLLLYNDNAYKRAVAEWDKYFNWRANRNESRWHGKDGSNFDYDHKNIMHCMRLLLSGENILKYGEPIVRFKGEQLEYLRDIRAGKFQYEQIMSEIEKRMHDLEKIKNESPLPQSADKKKINQLYLEIVDQWETEHPMQVFR